MTKYQKLTYSLSTIGSLPLIFIFSLGCSESPLRSQESPLDHDQVTLFDSQNSNSLSYILETSGAKTASAPDWWQNVGSTLSTTPLGHKVAVSCHNCYADEQDHTLSLDEATTQIGKAIDDGANFIEFDILYNSDEKLCVSHVDVGSMAESVLRGSWLGSIFANLFGKLYDFLDGCLELKDLLEVDALKNSNVMLFFEIKEERTDDDGDIDPDMEADFAQDLLNTLLVTTDDNGSSLGDFYATANRPIFIRGITRQSQKKGSSLLTSKYSILKAVYDKLNTKEFKKYRDYVKFSQLLWDATNEDVESIANDADLPTDLIEFYSNSKNIMNLTQYAQSLGLLVGYFTLKTPEHIAALREEADVMTTSYGISNTVDVIQESNVLAYLDVSNWSGEGQEDSVDTLSLSFYPTWLGDQGNNGWLGQLVESGEIHGVDGFTGGVLSFDSSQSQKVDLGSQSNTKGNGFLVTALVSFSDLNPKKTQVVLSNAQKAGFTLELIPRNGDTILRFGVYFKGSFIYDEINVFETELDEDQEDAADKGHAQLEPNVPYFIMGRYDGNGDVALFVDNVSRVRDRDSYHEGVKKSKVLLTIGADPQRNGKARSYFDGYVQQAMVLDWKDR